MRRDVTADLEHDLGMPPQRDRTDVAAPEPAGDVRRHPAAKAGEPPCGQALSPHCEEIADSRRRAACNLDDTGWRGRPHRIRTPRRDDIGTVARERRCHPDAGRHEKHAPVREQLDVSERSLPRRVGALETADRQGVTNAGRHRRKAVTPADADRGGDRRAAASCSDQGCGRNEAGEHVRRIDASFVPAARNRFATLAG